MGWLWEAVQGIGAVVGLATGAYVLIERWTKDYPSVFIFAKPLSDFGHRSLYLRVNNRSERPILISVQNTMGPGRFNIAKDHSTEAILVSMLYNSSTYGIDGKTEVDMPLLMPPGINEDDYDPDNTIELTVRWKYVQPIVLIGERKVRVISTKRDLRALLGLRGDDELI